MRNLVVPLADLLLGAHCAGCRGPALMLCRECGELIRPQPAEVWPDPMPQALRLPRRVVLTAAGVNAGTLQRVIVAWKEGGVSRLSAVLDHHVAAAVALHARSGRRLMLVPVPTSRRSRRQRGGDLVTDLARSAARLLRTTGVDVSVVDVLALNRTPRDQAGLGEQARRTNLAGAMRVRPGCLAGAADIVVVDDIVTSGSTVAEAVRVLTEAGHRPVGAACVAATPRDFRGTKSKLPLHW